MRAGRDLQRHVAESLFLIKANNPSLISVDASLWIIIAVNDYLLAATKQPSLTDDCHTKNCVRQSKPILAGYNEGTLFRNPRGSVTACSRRANTVEATWMDARVDARRSLPVSASQWKFRGSG